MKIIFYIAIKSWRDTSLCFSHIIHDIVLNQNKKPKMTDEYVKEPNLIHLSCVQHPFTLTSWTFLFPGHHFHSLTLCLHLLSFQYLFDLIKPENTNNFQKILLLNTVISSALTQQSSKKMVLNHDVLFSTKYCQITTIVTGEQHLC